ncbi:MAG: hypothetical protein V5A64_03810 [Candidatus Thermoplasmatota archaeon]
MVGDTSKFQKLDFTIIHDSDKDQIIQNIDKSVRKIKKIREEDKKNLEFFIPTFEVLINTYLLSKNVCAESLGSQLKILAQIFYHFPNSKLNKILNFSIKILNEMRREINEEKIIDVSSSIASWYNLVLTLLPLEEKNVDIRRISMDFKKRGELVIKNPKQVKELYQLFVDYSNFRFQLNSKIYMVPFTVKYLQQVFKEISYDGGILFDERTYDEFIVQFGRICMNVGENFLNSNEDDVFKTIIKLYVYSNDLMRVLNENKISRYY